MNLRPTIFSSERIVEFVDNGYFATKFGPINSKQNYFITLLLLGIYK